MNSADCYKILEIQDGASHKEVKAARRRLSKEWHPDTVAHDLDLQAIAQEKTKQINIAVDFLLAQPETPSPKPFNQEEYKNYSGTKKKSGASDDQVRQRKQREQKQAAEEAEAKQRQREAKEKQQQKETDERLRQEADAERLRREAEAERLQREAETERLRQREQTLAAERVVKQKLQWEVQRKKQEAEAAYRIEQNRQREAARQAKARHSRFLWCAFLVVAFIQYTASHHKPKVTNWATPSSIFSVDNKSPENSSHYQAGLAYNDAGNYTAAAEEFELVTTDNPNDAKSFYELGLALHNLNRLDDAIAQYRRAIAIDPNLTKAHDNLGAALDSSGQIEEGIDEDKIAIQQDSTKPHPHFDMALGLLKLKDYKNAMKENEEALRLDNGNDTLFTANLKMNFGCSLSAEGFHEKALAEMLEAIKLKGRADATDHFDLGLELGACGHRKEAIAELNQAAGMEPDNTAIRNAIQQLSP